MNIPEDENEDDPLELYSHHGHQARLSLKNKVRVFDPKPDNLAPSYTSQKSKIGFQLHESRLHPTDPVRREHDRVVQWWTT